MLYNYKAVGDLWEQVSCNNSAMVFTTFGMVLDDSITAEQHFKWNENIMQREGQMGYLVNLVLFSPLFTKFSFDIGYVFFLRNQNPEAAILLSPEPKLLIFDAFLPL